MVTKLWNEFVKDHMEVVTQASPASKVYLNRRPGAAKNFATRARKNIRARTGKVFIAEVDEKPAGYSLLFIRTVPPISRLHRLGYISDMYVRKKYRGLGISSKLNDEATKWFRQKGIKHVALVVMTGNSLAHSIYEKWGFFDYHVEMRKKI